MSANTTTSTVTVDGTSGFALFGKLPAELRNQVWEYTLPCTLRSALVPYKTGCWVPTGAEPDLYVEFRHDKLGKVSYEVPLAYVNHEARTIALAWVRKQGLVMCATGKRDPGFARDFDLTKDVLYFGPGELDRCYRDFWARLFEPDLLQRNLSTFSWIRQVAMPGSLFQDTEEAISEVLEDLYHIRTLFVVADPPLYLPSTGFEQPLWELVAQQGPICSWNQAHSRLEWSSKNGRDDEIWKLDIPQETVAKFRQHRLGSFDIHYGLAAKGEGCIIDASVV